MTIMVTKDKLINSSKRKRRLGGGERQVGGERKSLERKERVRRKLRKKTRKEGKRIGRSSKSESSTLSGTTKKAGRENRRRRNSNSQEATTSTSRLTLTTSSTTDSLFPQPRCNTIHTETLSLQETALHCFLALSIKEKLHLHSFRQFFIVFALKFESTSHHMLMAKTKLVLVPNPVIIENENYFVYTQSRITMKPKAFENVLIYLGYYVTEKK